ncbi:zinc finger MYM-type protein 1-like [Clytia hemisphaerica]|uniref:zinc finger MYM-type protein 1-like n=1 Tax=Clytia hemisphaerica TaxID=252671 RepID=UPI0034D4D083
MGRKSGVSTQILAEQPKAVAIHCEGHSLSLSIKSLTSECDTLKDTLSVVKEICVLVKYSPKRENLLGNIHESIEKSGEDFEPMKKLTKLSTTRWTVRAECMKRIIDNYESLLLLWDECLKEKLDQETKARIIGCKSQMRSFNFYFGLTLSHTLHNMIDNLSRSLQGEKMSALSGRKSAELVIETISKMRADEEFVAFYETTTKDAEALKKVCEPKLPRKRKKPKNYSILQYVTRPDNEKESEAYYPKNPEEHYHLIFNAAIDILVNVMQDRFNQPALKNLKMSSSFF